MPRHLISDAHEWINEIPTVPRFPKFSLSSFSPPGGRFPSPATVPRAAPTRGCRRSSPAATWMAGPPSHVPPSSLVPPTVQPLSSSTPSLSASSPRSDPDPPLSPLRNSLSSNPQPPPPPTQLPIPSPAPPPTLLLPSLPNPSSSSEIHASLILYPPRSASVSAAANPFPSLPSSSAPLPSAAISSNPVSPLPPPNPPVPNPIPSSLPVPPPSTPAPDLVVPPSASVPSSHHTPHTIPTRPLLSNPHRSSNPSHHQPSYAQIARGSRGPGFVRSHASDVEAFARLPRTGINIICGSREGLPSFSFTNSDLPRVEKLYSNALVMKFHGGRPSLESSHKEISSWGMNQPFSIGPLSSRAFLLRFQDETDLLKVLTRPSTALINFPYKVFRWHSLCHIKEDSCIAPVWISLPRLPLQCFVPEFLEAVANKIGRFLSLDKATATLARPSAARLCVELDLRSPLPQFIWVGLFDGFKQAVLYEKLPKFCNVCHIQGHSTVECFKAPSAVVCPLGHRETPTSQTGAYGIPTHQRTQSVRQNASKQLTSLHQQPTSSTTTPFPHIPSIPPNPPPSSSQALPTTLHPSPQAAVLPPPSQTSATIPSSTTPAPNIDHSQIQQTSTLVQRSPTSAAASLTPPAHSPLISPSAAAPSPSDALLQVQPTAALLQRVSTAAATSAAPSAGTQHQQTNIEVNKAIWEAVNRQVAILDQARLTDSAAAIKPRNKNQFSTAKSIKIKPSDVGNSTSLSKQQAAALEQFKGKVLEQTRIRDLHLTNPTSMNHFQALRDDHSEADDEAVSYYSDTDEGCVEPIEMGYQSANGRSSNKPSGLKTNKRHPNMPLHVRLRSRKPSYPSNP